VAARAHFYEAAIDRQGNALPKADISVFLRGTTTLATIYPTEASSTVMPNPYTVTDGVVSHWAPAGAYDVLVHDATFPARVEDRTYGWGAVPGIDRGIPGRMLEAGAVGTTELSDLSVSSAKVQGNSIQTGHLQDGAVTAAKVAADMATQAELDAALLKKPYVGLVIALGG